MRESGGRWAWIGDTDWAVDCSDQEAGSRPDAEQDRSVSTAAAMAQAGSRDYPHTIAHP